MSGVAALGLTAALLLLALFALLTALVVLSVLRLFCHDPSRCLYAARNCNQSFGTGLKRLVEYMGWRIGASSGCRTRRLFPDCVSARWGSRLARTPCCQWVTV